MSDVDERVESELMPDWNRQAADEIDRIDWQAIADPGKDGELTPHAALSQET